MNTCIHQLRHKHKITYRVTDIHKPRIKDKGHKYTKIVTLILKIQYRLQDRFLKFEESPIKTKATTCIYTIGVKY